MSLHFRPEVLEHILNRHRGGLAQTTVGQLVHVFTQPLQLIQITKLSRAFGQAG
jgi:hypothetical protein